MKNTKLTIHHMPITEARVNLGAVVKRVHLKGEYFILEKDGIPVAGLLSVDELEDYLELRNPRVIKQMAQSKKDYDGGQVSSARALLAEIRSGRPGEVKRVPGKKTRRS